MPPQEIWQSIQDIRATHDAAYKRWPPHINVLYPFVKESFFDAEIETIAGVLSGIEPFEIVLKRFNYFDKRNQQTLYVFLQPSPAKAIGKLQQIYDSLIAKYPACASAKNRSQFHGHLTCGQFASDSIRSTVTDMNSAWETLTFTCDSVQLISRYGNDQPFEVRHEIKLGQSQN
jgi:poly(A) polymerase